MIIIIIIIVYACRLPPPLRFLAAWVCGRQCEGPRMPLTWRVRCGLFTFGVGNSSRGTLSLGTISWSMYVTSCLQHRLSPWTQLPTHISFWFRQMPPDIVNNINGICVRQSQYLCRVDFRRVIWDYVLHKYPVFSMKDITRLNKHVLCSIIMAYSKYCTVGFMCYDVYFVLSLLTALCEQACTRLPGQDGRLCSIRLEAKHSLCLFGYVTTTVLATCV